MEPRAVAKPMIFDVPQSVDDKEFRAAVKRMIDGATTEVLVMAGELGSLMFPDLHDAVMQAKKRGVNIRFYASAPSPAIVDDLRANGMEIHIGPVVLKDHYLAVDGRDYAVSLKDVPGKPTQIGTRRMQCGLDEPKTVQKLKRTFLELQFLWSVEESVKTGSLITRFFSWLVEVFARGLTTTGVEPSIVR
jgi:hypothetical protein